jgi:peptidyl-prolyl cis-trans isomerase A (cyclophilin A)
MRGGPGRGSGCVAGSVQVAAGPSFTLRGAVVTAALLACVVPVAGRLAPDPPVPAGAQTEPSAPERFLVRLETSRGEMRLDVRREWSPHGADRFHHLVRVGYYDGARFFRVIEGRWAQFGINGDPETARAWRTRTIPDDPRRMSNVRGTVAFAFAVPGGRTTQVFINLRDNSATHDVEPFVPFGQVIAGMEAADALYAGYGESAGGGIRAGRQGPLFDGGNAYLAREFPRLDFIVRATVVESEEHVACRGVELVLTNVLLWRGIT